MARAKPAWRKVLNARFLRWWGLRHAVRLWPGLSRRLAFFPRAVGMIEAADTVLADARHLIPAEDLTPDLDFLQRCLPHDTTAPGLTLPDGVETGPRTALYKDAWIDMATGSILLPKRGATMIVRGERANWNATSARPRRPRVEIPETVFAPLNTVQYFHLLLENGLRVLDLMDSGTVPDLTLVTPAPRTAVERAMYQGIAATTPGLALRQVPGDALVIPETACMHFPYGNHHEWPPMNRALADRLGAAFDAVYGDTARPEGPARLHLSRKGAKLRNPNNADDVDTLLSRHGFTPFVATDRNHPEQIARFRAARTIVAVHGAGLTNLVFCRPGTRVIEVFPENFVKSPYWWMCRQLGLTHVPVIGGPGDYDQNFHVDIAALSAALGQIPDDSP